MSGDATQEVWRPPGAPYPMPPLPVTPQGEILRRGFERVGQRVAPAPLAINSIAYRGRPACINDGWCDAGCPTLALVNPFAVHIPKARRAGARFVNGATVTRITLDGRGRAAGVDFVGADGPTQHVPARLTVLAGASIQNARLLLASAQRGAAKGIGNDRDLVGRFFVCHNVVNVYGLFAEETANHLGVTAGSLISQEGYHKVKGGEAFGSYQWGIAPAIKPNDLLGIAQTRADLFGESLHRFMHTAARHLASMSALCETLPQFENRIELTSNVDRFGVPLARIVRNADAAGPALARWVTEDGLRVMRAAGARESWQGILATSHPLGGTVMGETPDDSVTDSYGRVHGVPGLLISGGGVFPTAGGGSPTFTILALAERSADQMLKLGI